MTGNVSALAAAPLPLGSRASLLVSMTPGTGTERRCIASPRLARPARRRPARPRRGAALPRRRQARRAEGRGGHGAQGGKILLRIDRRGFGHHPSARGDRGPPGSAGPEGRGNPRRGRRHRDSRSSARAAQPSRRRIHASAGVRLVHGRKFGGEEGEVGHRLKLSVRPRRPPRARADERPSPPAAG